MYIQNNMSEHWNLSQADEIAYVKERNWFLIAKYGNIIAYLKECTSKEDAKRAFGETIDEYSGFVEDIAGDIWNIGKAMKLEALPKKIKGKFKWCVAAIFDELGAKYFMPSKSEEEAEKKLEAILRRLGNG